MLVELASSMRSGLRESRSELISAKKHGKPSRMSSIVLRLSGRTQRQAMPAIRMKRPRMRANQSSDTNEGEE